VVAGRLVRLACERHISDLRLARARRFDGCWFDEVEARRAIEFFGLLSQSKGEWAGKPLRLEPWQAFIIGSIWGWKRRDGTRRFSTAYLEIPRKNGKSTLSGGAAIRLAFFDGEPGAEVYCAATKRDQAKIVWGEAKRMILASPALRRRLQALVSNINDPRTNSKLEPLGADADGMDGLNAHAFVLDELHKHKTRAIVDVMETATSARRQPLNLEITTAGSERNTVCWEHHEYSIKVLEGALQDNTWFGYIATIDPGDRWDDEVAWAKANPNLGLSVKVDDLRRKARRALEIPAERARFLRLHLNVWTQNVAKWIPVELWNSCRPRRDPAMLVGRRCFGGLDLGAVSDLSALALIFPDGGDVDVLMWFWCPREGIERRSRTDRVPYDEWARVGLIKATEGNVTDYDVIREDVKLLGRRYQIAEIDFDPWNATQLANQLTEDGANMVDCGQGFASMSGPTKEVQRLFASGALRHGHNPVLDWMASNAAIRLDPADNMKVDKKRSSEKVDGIVALVMAQRAMTMTKNAGPHSSIYNTRGLDGVY